MAEYLIKSMEVSGLWGERNVTLDFYPDVNIIVGANGSGKTTLLNLLRFVLTGDLQGLFPIEFEEVRIKLKAFSGPSTRTVNCTKLDTGFKFKIGSKSFSLGVPTYRPAVLNAGRMRRLWSPPSERRALDELRTELAGLVPTIWLPVSRRLPTGASDDGPSQRLEEQGRMESVDERLTHLAQSVVVYRAHLNAQISATHKEFEKKVLQHILYNKQFDTAAKIAGEPLGADEMAELTNAFESAGLLDDKMRTRIQEHFKAAKEALDGFTAKPAQLTMKQIFVLPLISRTRSMVEDARSLEHERSEILEPIKNYVRTVNEFFRNKGLHVNTDGTLSVESSGSGNQIVDLDKLSSGEKQLLILLTEALLWEGKPVVYVADEPELSLHILWQERLISSITRIARNTQVIVATHSPDMVAEFGDKVIQLSVGSD